MLHDSSSSLPATDTATPAPATAPADANMPVRSARASAPARSLPESPDLSAARGKGGCWTCRLRRKKCDEQRENGSCQTCLRLKIECLGWGVRRPEWMRDKAQVEAYKAGIKRQLSSQGMIRGQPRTPVIPTGANMSPLQYQYPITPRGMPLMTGDSDEADEYTNFEHPSANASPAYPPIQMPQLATGLDLHLYPTSAATAHTPQPHPLPSQYTSASPHAVPSMMPFTVPSQPFFEPQAAAINHPSFSSETRQQLVLYYFRQVRQIQFIFAGPGLTSVFHDTVVREPTGAVADAICALAALHKSQMRPHETLENPAAESTLFAQTKQFYDQAWWQLLNSKQRNGRFTEQDAMAAIHLVSYWVFCGGGTGWQAPLNVACDWLADSPLTTAANARLQWLQFSASAKFTAQMTMWFDIFSAISMNRSPRFMDLYRRLFRTDSSYWTGSPQGGHVQDLQMEALTGCPDAVMYAFAETANLAAWKIAQQQSLSLSVRELVRRADAIEQELRGGWMIASPESFPHIIESHYELHTPGPSRTSSASSHPSAHPSPARNTIELVSPTSVAVSTPEPTIGAETRRVVSNVFFESAVLYLHTVVNDHNPVVTEIMEGVNATMQALNKLALSEVDRGLVFPICLAGCLTDIPEHREFFKQRLDALCSTLGSFTETRRLMEVVWQKRDNHGGVIDWRHTMPDLGLNLLVV